MFIATSLLGFAGRERCRFPGRQDTRELVDADVLDGAVARGGNIRNEQESRCKDAEDRIQESGFRKRRNSAAAALS